MHQHRKHTSRGKNIEKILQGISSQSNVSDRTTDRIDRWWVDNEKNPELDEAMKRLFIIHDAVHCLPGEDCLKSLKRVRRQLGIKSVAIPGTPRRRTHVLMARIAALVLVLVGIGAVLSVRMGGHPNVGPAEPTAEELRAMHLTAIEQEPHRVIETIEDVQKSALLPDSTQVWVNAQSRLVAPETFGDERRVKLEGEAIFEVKQDDKPFYVHTERLDIRAVGTSFHVTCSSDEPQTVVTLIEGAVEVTCGDVMRRMEPGQRLAFDNRTGEMVVETVDLQALRKYDWRSEVVSAQMKTMPEILRMVANYYDRRIVFDEDLCGGNRYSIDFGKKENAEEVVRVLAEVSDGFSVEQRNGEIIVNAL